MSKPTTLRCIYRALLPFAVALAPGALAEDEADPPSAGLPVADLARQTPVNFAAEVLPILRANCLACHSKAEAKGGLVLEDPEAVRKGGKGGPAVIAGDGKGSLLFLAASRRAKPLMPPVRNKVGARNLNPDELALLKLWIEQGATGKVPGTSGVVEWHKLASGPRPVYAVAVSRAGDLAVASRANQMTLYEVPSGRVVAELTDPALVERGLYAPPGAAHLDSVQAVAFHPDGDMLGSGGFREVKLWRRPGGVRTRTLAHEAPATSAAAAGASAAPIEVAAFASRRDGKAAATGTAQGSIHAWSLEAEVHSSGAWSGHSSAVTALGFSPDGARLASVGADRALHVWRIADRAEESSTALSAGARAVAFAAAGAVLGVGAEDGFVRVYRLPLSAGAAPEKEWKAHEKPIVALEPRGDGEVVTAAEDGSLALWALADGHEVRRIANGAAAAALAVRPDGKNAAVASADGYVRVWGLDDAKQIFAARGDFRLRRRESLRSEEAKLAGGRVEAAKKVVADGEGELKKHSDALAKSREELVAVDKDIAEKKDAAGKETEPAKLEAAKKALAEAEGKRAPVLEKLKSLEEEVARATKHLEESRAALVDRTGAAATSQEALAAASAAVSATEGALRSVAYSADGLDVVAGSADGRLLVWSGENGAPRQSNGVAGSAVLGVVRTESQAALPQTSARELVTFAASGEVVCWDADPPWRLAETLGGAEDGSAAFTGRVLALDFARDGRLLLAGGGEPSRSGELRLWDIAARRWVWSLPEAHSDSVFAVELSSDGRFAASAAADKFVRVFSVADGTLVRALEGHTHHVLGVAWKRDGSALASCGADKTVRIWSFPAGDPLRSVGGFSKQVSAVEFLGDTANVLCAAGDPRVRELRSDNGQTVRDYGGTKAFMYAVAASGDGKVAAAGGFDGTLFLWEGGSDKVIAAISAVK